MRCQQCRGKFGLIRHRILTYRGYLSFCRAKCKADFIKERDEAVRKRKFVEWLMRPG
jgi:hypothetical protein